MATQTCASPCHRSRSSTGPGFSTAPPAPRGRRTDRPASPRALEPLPVSPRQAGAPPTPAPPPQRRTAGAGPKRREAGLDERGLRRPGHDHAQPYGQSLKWRYRLRQGASIRREPGGTRHAWTGSDDARAWRGVKRSAAELDRVPRGGSPPEGQGRSASSRGEGVGAAMALKAAVRSSVTSPHGASSPPPPPPTSLPTHRPPPARPLPHPPSPRERQRPAASPGPRRST